MGAVLPGEYRRPPLARLARPAAFRSRVLSVPGGGGGLAGPASPACAASLPRGHRAVGGAGRRREGGWLGGWRASSGQRPVTACGLEARPALSPVGDSLRPNERATFRGDLLTRFSTRLCRGAAQAEEDREGRGGEQPA